MYGTNSKTDLKAWDGYKKKNQRIGNLFNTCWEKKNNIWYNLICLENWAQFLNVPIFISFFMVQYSEVSIWDIKKFWEMLSLLELLWIYQLFEGRVNAVEEFCICQLHTNSAYGVSDRNMQSKRPIHSVFYQMWKMMFWWLSSTCYSLQM